MSRSRAETFSEEARRLQALQEYAVLESAEEQAYDDITRMAASICETPIALISLTDSDRQWFKSRVGFHQSEIPREYAFCAAAIECSRSTDVLVIDDVTKDPRFAKNSLVNAQPPIRFYAGAPLIAPSGHAIGTLCVLDWTPRHLAAEQVETLLFLAAQVMAKLEVRKRDLAKL